MLQPEKPELLAPAGSLPAFFAALEAGADAIYCGLQEFSARAKARNFTINDMARLSALAHQQGRRLYVALNTLIKEDELERLVEVLTGLYECRVDGLIIQDLGVWQLCRRQFPELPLHASTQMTVHNGAGVRMLEEMGFSRAVLARELSLTEIAAIRSQTSMELEHFIHGALCFSISGHCLFSAYLHGQSGNRGRCRQPCRRRYSRRGQSGFHLSPDDIATLELLPELAEAGVMSFKIEGRMKSAEYVDNVVRAYRLVLDAPPAHRRQAKEEAGAILAQALGRPTTSAFFRGTELDTIVDPQRRGGIGRELGEVERLIGPSVVFTCRETIHVGDRLRIQPRHDQSGIAFTIRTIQVGKRPMKRAEAGSRVEIPTPFKGRFQNGDLIYKVATGKGFTLSDEACRRRLNSVNPAPTPVTLTICAATNLLKLTAEAGGITFSREYEAAMEPANRSPLCRETLLATFGRTGQPDLTLAHLAAFDLPPVVIKPSRLKEIRRDFYSRLNQAVAHHLQETREQHLTRVRATLLPRQPVQATTVPAPFTVVVRHSSDLAAQAKPAAHRFILPLLPNSTDTLPQPAAELIWDIPAILFGEEWDTMAGRIRTLLKHGFQGFRLNNIGHFRFFNPGDQVELWAGPWLYTTNSQAVLALAALGCRCFSLALEDDRDNMATLLARSLPLPAAATVYAPIDLLTSRIPLPRQKNDETLQADNRQTLRLAPGGSLTVIRAATDFSLIGHLHELRTMGVEHLVIDLADLGAASPAGQQVLAAAARDETLPATSSFNYDRHDHGRPSHRPLPKKNRP